MGVNRWQITEDKIMGYFKQLAIMAMDDDEEVLMRERRSGWDSSNKEEE